MASRYYYSPFNIGADVTIRCTEDQIMTSSSNTIAFRNGLVSRFLYNVYSIVSLGDVVESSHLTTAYVNKTFHSYTFYELYLSTTIVTER